MEPHIITTKDDVHNVFFISCKEVLKPSAILHMFFQFVHWCYLVWT